MPSSKLGIIRKELGVSNRTYDRVGVELTRSESRFTPVFKLGIPRNEQFFGAVLVFFQGCLEEKEEAIFPCWAATECHPNHQDR